MFIVLGISLKKVLFSPSSFSHLVDGQTWSMPCMAFLWPWADQLVGSFLALLLLMHNCAEVNHFSFVYFANSSSQDMPHPLLPTFPSLLQSSNLLCSNNFPLHCSCQLQCQMALVLSPLTQPPLRTAAIVIAVNTSWLWTHSGDPNLMLSIGRGWH